MNKLTYCIGEINYSICPLVFNYYVFLQLQFECRHYHARRHVVIWEIVQMCVLLPELPQDLRKSKFELVKITGQVSARVSFG